jgi:hypothetical protein
MKRLFWIFLFVPAVVLLAACQNGGSDKSLQNARLNTYDSTSSQGPVIRFYTTEYDFGRVYEGEKVGWYFKFKNLGNKNLVLTNVEASCGCTTPAYSNEPVTPGLEGEIKVVFDTKGRVGKQYKTITVETNANPKITELIITAEVIKK